LSSVATIARFKTTGISDAGIRIRRSTAYRAIVVPSAARISVMMSGR
jgi:hypothetical protein